jgi:hypothetical protein
VVQGNPEGAFVISPFSDDFHYLYDYYISKLNVGHKWGGRVRRADSIGRTGYVMCSRICYPIQRSAVVIADITEPNLNVFYELGLACALNKQILLLSHRTATPRRIGEFITRLCLPIQYYDSQAPVTDAALGTVSKPNLFADGTSPRSNSVIVFSNESAVRTDQDPPVLLYRHHKMHGIIRRILETLADPARSQELQEVVKRAQMILQERGAFETGKILDERTVQALARQLWDNTKAVSGQDDVRGSGILAATFVFIDTTIKDFETYFWLGACHGLQQQVVPFSILDRNVTTKDLPFDVRTLWHIDGSFRERENIERQVTHILIELIAKVVAARELAERERFWGALAQEPKPSFYIGTEQSSQLQSKQVVGEWDLRTCQELSAFATRINPNLDVSIEKPAFKRLEYSPQDIERFRELLRERVGKSHCIIIGTPDVNPVAEMALSELAGVPPFRNWFAKQLQVTEEGLERLKGDGLRDNQAEALRCLVGRIFSAPEELLRAVSDVIKSPADEVVRLRTALLKHSWRSGDGPETPEQLGPEKIGGSYVAFKHHLFRYCEPRPSSFFYQFDSGTPLRGFMYYGTDGRYKGRYHKDYTPREQMSVAPHSPDNITDSATYRYWDLLGHLIVCPNPFAKGFPNTRLRTILLMGVGGPATLGLAHLLTGRVPDRMFPNSNDRIDDTEFVKSSERFLKEVNALMHDHKSAEAIVRIRVMNSMKSLNNDYEDSRQIESIVIAESLPGVRNPKEFQFRKS